MSTVNALRILAWAGISQVFVVIIWLNIGSRHKKFAQSQLHAILWTSIGIAGVLIAVLAFTKHYS